ncbi:hypothetical protein [Candidatus Methylomicrobium oryzae]|uniref:hypothetical protein n=1 Tax=Candidatus Methylomicrobium oryzae TaxID=2802053 RepID=UPI0019229CA3|nr:hypothetical protein [Methylomicrobium sp. RS1]MBL1262066.1 hypothetical protein [Methylomicrobium sp. RS1]
MHWYSAPFEFDGGKLTARLKCKKFKVQTKYQKDKMHSISMDDAKSPVSQVTLDGLFDDLEILDGVWSGRDGNRLPPSVGNGTDAISKSDDGQDENFLENRETVQADQELMNKIFAGYGYHGGVDMPAGLNKTALKLYRAIVERDVDALVPILRAENKLSRKAFEYLFDGKLKLPRTIKGVLQVVEDFFGKINEKMESEAVQETETVTPEPKEDESTTQDEPVPVPKIVTLLLHRRPAHKPRLLAGGQEPPVPASSQSMYLIPDECQPIAGPAPVFL